MIKRKLGCKIEDTTSMGVCVCRRLRSCSSRPQMGVLMAVLGGLPPGIPLLDQRALTARWFVDKDFDFVIKHLNGARRTAATAPYRVFRKDCNIFALPSQQQQM